MALTSELCIILKTKEIFYSDIKVVKVLYNLAVTVFRNH